MSKPKDPNTWHGAHIVSEDELNFVSDARAKRRTRKRQNIFFSILAVLVLIAFVGATLIFTGVWKIEGLNAAGASDAKQTQTIENPACPEVEFELTEPSSFSIRVVNTTDTSGLAGKTAEALRERGFKISATSSGMSAYAQGTATIISGPKGYAQALTLQRQIPKSRYVFKEDKRGTNIDLALGEDFKALEKDRKIDSAPGTLTCAEAE